MKTYATLGPACCRADLLTELLDMGLTGFRLNLSHTTLTACRPWTEAVQQARATSGRPAELIVDMRGPELRMGPLSRPVTLTAGETVILGPGGLPVEPDILAAVAPGQEILLDDGLMALRAESCGRAVTCTVTRGGVLESRKSITLPGVELCRPALTEQDLLDLDAAAPEGWAEDKRPVIPAHARSVWEVHVADFSADEHSGVPAAWRGKFMGFVPADTTLDGDGVHQTCLNYLKDLGISHVQLQPIFDYETVDETRPDGGYNWGYDPQNYNVPEGSFATDPFHGEVRVRECRAMVAALHRAGLGVVMDVVYNHTYHSDSNLERTVPGYWNRRWPNDQMTNGSGCGCYLASERPMVRKYIVDSILYWAQTYHIDGFRFDLMALEDADTMNAIRAALDALPGGQDILLYGEPWQGGSTNFEGGARPADKRALDVLSDRIGFFCDDTRDSIKGNVFDAGNAGYVNGALQHGYEVLHSIGAWRGGQHGYWPRQAGQVVQYISAHDNLTLWDKLAAVGRRGDYDAPDAELLAQNRLAAGIYLTCQGLPFMQAGEEWGRTKHGDHNSYKGPLATNRLDWTRAHRPEFAALTAFYRGMLAIRRAYPRLSGAAGEPEPFILALPGWLIGFVPENDGTATAGQLAVYYNPERTRQWASLPAGTWRKVSDGVHAGVTPFGPCFRDALELAPTSVTVLVAE